MLLAAFAASAGLDEKQHNGGALSMSVLSIFWLIGFVMAGAALLVGAVKGSYRLLRHNLIAAGAAIGISALLTYAMATARTGDEQIFWSVMAVLVQVTTCAMAGLFFLGVLLAGKKDGTMGIKARAGCLGLVGVFFAGSLLVLGQKEIATALQRRAIAAGSPSSLAKKITRELKYWDALARLEPSPQKEKLLSMVQPSFWPPDGFWETVLSLPPSPERLALITSFSHDMLMGKGGSRWLAVLYDQRDTEGLEAVFQKNEWGSFVYLPADIVALGRADILHDVLRRGGAQINEHGRHNALLAAIEKNSPEMLALLLDSGISPNTTLGISPLNAAVRRNRIEMARLLLERGADINKNCLIMHAVRYPDMLSLLLEGGASPLCARDGSTLLHQAARDDASAPSMALLLRLGIPLDTPDKDGRSPFLLAAREGAYTALDRLAAAGADVSLRDAGGRTALHLAVQNPYSSNENRYRVMARLMVLSPDLASVRDAEGKTPLDYAEDEKTQAILQEGPGQ